MNIAIYWNPKNVANQMLFRAWFLRMSYLQKNNLLKSKYRFLREIFNIEELSVEKFLLVDDSIVNSAIRYSTYEDDEIIKIIANKFLKQQRPETIFGKEKVDKFENQQDLNLRGQTWEIVEISTDFSFYKKKNEFVSKILTNDNEVISASKYSTVLNENNQRKNPRIKRLGVKII